MKKKIFFGFIFAFLILFTSFQKIYADCVSVPSTNCVSPHPYSCQSGSSLYCCVNPSECIPTPIPASCGGSYQVCCSTSGSTACDNSGGGNLSCIAGHCTPGSACGSAGQACCAGNVCNNGISCINGSCGAVGVPGSSVNSPSLPAGNTTNLLCGNGKKGIDTAIGCIPVLNDDKGVSFMVFILRWGVGAGGGIAFLLILYGSFMVMTSQGNPERIKAGQELITSAVSGLILLIFSIFLLKFIGVDILSLNSFGFNQ